jgi:hypothetical protein
MVDKPDRFYLDPDKVRKVEFFHQPPVANACALRSSTSQAR